jgi:hypothetical protein
VHAELLPPWLDVAPEAVRDALCQATELALDAGVVGVPEPLTSWPAEATLSAVVRTQSPDPPWPGSWSPLDVAVMIAYDQTSGPEALQALATLLAVAHTPGAATWRPDRRVASEAARPLTAAGLTVASMAATSQDRASTPMARRSALTASASASAGPAARTLISHRVRAPAAAQQPGPEPRAQDRPTDLSGQAHLQTAREHGSRLRAGQPHGQLHKAARVYGQ